MSGREADRLPWISPMDLVFGVLATALIVLLVAWQAALLRKAEPARRAQRDAVLTARARLLARAPVPTDVFGKFVDYLRRRPWMRRGLSGLSGLAFVLAIALIGFPLYTNLVPDRIQQRLPPPFSGPPLPPAHPQRRGARGGRPDPLPHPARNA